MIEKHVIAIVIDIGITFDLPLSNCTPENLINLPFPSFMTALHDALLQPTKRAIIGFGWLVFLVVNHGVYRLNY